jgi:hypothetical protein
LNLQPHFIIDGIGPEDWLVAFQFPGMPIRALVRVCPAVDALYVIHQTTASAVHETAAQEIMEPGLPLFIDAVIHRQQVLHSLELFRCHQWIVG